MGMFQNEVPFLAPKKNLPGVIFWDGFCPAKCLLFKEEKRAPQFETYPIYIFKQKNIVLHTPSYHKKRDVAILDPYGNCSGWLCCQVDRVKALHEQYRDDKDAVLTPTGVHFIGPGGRVENEAEHCARLAHNCRMRFNRSFTGLGIQN